MTPIPRPENVDEDDDLWTPKGCKVEYEKLEDCLADNDRDWTKCQKEVHALRKCNKVAAKEQDIKLEYRDGRIERDPEKIEQRLLAAVRGLDQLQSYAGMKRTAGDWDLALRGPV